MTNTDSITPTGVNNTTGTGIAGTAYSSDFVDFLLAEFRLAAIRARLIENSIVTAGTALNAGMIDAIDALEIVAEAPGALALIAPSSTWWPS